MHTAETNAKPTRPFALVGWFKTPAELYHACEKLRDAGFKHFDAHTPFPVHGLERAMGLKPSRLPWIVLCMGLFGLCVGFALQMWTLGVDYPMNISGKPFFAVPAYIPVAFEVTVLLSSFGCFLGMWGLNGLPRFFHPVMQHPSFHRATDNCFFVSVEVKDPKYDATRTLKMLEEAGAQELQEVAS
ncbi:MAG: DUF3341 domain-containing protein [Myxococcota bacterium]